MSRAVAAGALAGAVGRFVINQFQTACSVQTIGVAKGHGAQTVKTGGPAEYETRPDSNPEADDATTKMAGALAEHVADRPLTEPEKEEAGVLVHYAFGASMGALYGVAAAANPKLGRGSGVPFGLAVWAGADQLAVPALGLARKPWEYPLWVQVQSLLSHVVFGITTDMVRRQAMRR